MTRILARYRLRRLYRRIDALIVRYADLGRRHAPREHVAAELRKARLDSLWWEARL